MYGLGQIFYFLLLANMSLIYGILGLLSIVRHLDKHEYNRAMETFPTSTTSLKLRNGELVIIALIVLFTFLRNI